MSNTISEIACIEPSPLVLQPKCSVQTVSMPSSFGDSDSDDDMTLSSNDAAYRAAHGHLLGMNGKKVNLQILTLKHQSRLQQTTFMNIFFIVFQKK